MMYKRNGKFILIVACAFILSFNFVHANETGETEEVSAEITKSIDIKATKAAVREEMNKKISEEKELMKQKLSEKNELLKKNREELKENIQEDREAMKEKIKTEREEFKKKLEIIRDEKKKQVVESLDGRIENINANKTKHLLEVLERLGGALDKIESKSKDLGSKNVDLTSVNTAVATARADIAAAKTLIETQAAKSYVINISSESTLRSDVSTAINQLKSDLTASIEAVKKAKQSVQSALDALRALRLSSISPTTTE